MRRILQHLRPNDHRRHGRLTRHLVGDAAVAPSAEAGATVAGHDQQARGALLDNAQDLLGGIAQKDFRLDRDAFGLELLSHTSQVARVVLLASLEEILGQIG